MAPARPLAELLRHKRLIPFNAAPAFEFARSRPGPGAPPLLPPSGTESCENLLAGKLESRVGSGVVAVASPELRALPALPNDFCPNGSGLRG